jgi:sulfofructose kinase
MSQQPPPHAACPTFDVLGFGAVAVDDLLYVDEYPAAEQKVRVRQRRRQSGGLTGTALVAAARLGAKTGYAGLLGEDDLSQVIVQCFEREKIDFTHAVRRPEARPAHSTIIVDQTRKTRTIFASLDGLIGAHPQLPPAAVIRSADVLLVDHHGLEGTLRAVRIARDNGIAVVADFERDPGPPFAEILELVDHLIVSEGFARQLTDIVDPAAAAVKLWNSDRRAVVVTSGESGSWYVSADNSSQASAQHFPAFSVEVIDTTGCGDVFHGAYAAGLAENLDTHQCIELASATAALKATQRGGQAGIPRRKAVVEFLEQAANNQRQ